MNRRALSIALVPGDGIGPEVISEAVQVLQSVTEGVVDLRLTSFPLGAREYLRSGVVLPDATLSALGTHDAILLGAVGGKPDDPALAGGFIERELLLRIRFEFDQYVNVRPTKLITQDSSPLKAPGLIDLIIVREGTEGPYAGVGGSIRIGAQGEIATEVSVNTAFGVERLCRYAFGLAASRRQRITLVHKTNVLRFAGSLWARIFHEVSQDYSGVSVDYLHIDAATMKMVSSPASFDVIVTDNLFGDILSDLASVVGGGIGRAASANLNPAGRFPSMFEPVHGSAPDIAGLGVADPAAAVLSAALMLENSGFPQLGSQVSTAVTSELTSRNLSGPVSTAEIGRRIRERL